MAKKKVPQHGGKRPGAGRKAGPDGPTVLVTASVPSSIAEALDAYVAKDGCSRSEAVTRALRGLLGKAKPVAKS